jgi:hypothetical protein
MFLHRFSTTLIFLSAAAVAGAQTAKTPVPPPPVKMGLWETTVTTQMSGLQLSPEMIQRLKQMGRDAPGAPHTTVTRGCLTLEEWQKDMEEMNKPRNSDCTIVKHGDDLRALSFDVSCKTERSMVSGHWEMHVISDEHGQGSGHMKSDQTGPNGQSFVMDSTMDTRYVAADCGDVKPGDAKVMKQ